MEETLQVQIPELVDVSPPLQILPIFEPVQFGSPNEDRRLELQGYLHNIGEDARFDSLWGSLQFYNPLHAEHKGRLGYTPEQVKWTKYVRDKGVDQAPFPHIESVQELRRLGIATHAYIEALSKMELHHIYPQSYLQAYLGLGEEHTKLINHPHNGITLSRLSHTGPHIPAVHEPPHSDLEAARRSYGEDKNSIKYMLHNHWELAKNAVKFWFFAADEDMFKKATERTERMRARKKNV